METLLRSSLSEVFCLLLFIPEPGFSLKSLLFFPLQVQLLICWFKIVYQISLCILKIVFHHSSHSVELLGLLSVKIFLIFLLLSFLSFFFDLLIEPLFLFVLEELSPCIILCIERKNYWGPRLQISGIQRFRRFDLDCGIRGKGLFSLLHWFWFWMVKQIK